jgi:hypothetical protein
MTDFPPLLAAFVAHEHSRIDLAWHEAAHCVAGVLHGGTLTRAAITEGKRKGGKFGKPSGVTTFAALPSTRHALVAYAGPWGQARGRLGRRPGPVDLRRVLDSTGCKDRDVLIASGGDADPKVELMLENCWPAVHAIAAKLLRTASVTEADVLAALKLSADPATRVLETSMIRSGAAPGTFSVSRPA